MTVEDPNATTTRLLTLLNVSATKAGKRKRTFGECKPAEKLNKKRVVQIAAPDETQGELSPERPEEVREATRSATEEEEVVPEGEDEDEPGVWLRFAMEPSRVKLTYHRR